MTGPYPGQDPYGDQQTPWNQQPLGNQFPTGGYGGVPTPPKKKRTGLIVLVVALVVVIVGGTGTAIWLLVSRKDTSSTQAAPATSAPTSSQTTTSSRSTSAKGAPYVVGSCITRKENSPTSGTLSQVDCNGSDAVLKINKIVALGGDCGPYGDFKDYGQLVNDEYANVRYCTSLVVPVNQCFQFHYTGGPDQILRTACNDTHAVQVQSVESASSGSAACADKPNSDIWFYQSATSGQFACVSKNPANTASSPTSQ